MIDCLLVGYNELGFDEEVKRIKSMGDDSISYKDFSLGYIKYNHKPYRALDILNHFYYENRNIKQEYFHNADVLWQVIMYLGTYLKKNNFSFDYVNLMHLEKGKLKEKLIKEEYKTIVITTTIYISVHPILDAVKFIKQYNKTAKIIVGGPYISKQSDEVDLKTNQSMFKMINADFYIINLEGETTLVNLLKEINGSQNYSGIKNIAYKNGDNYIFTENEKETNSLENNMIDFSLFPKQEIRQTINIRTSKSCPFSCSYCGFPLRAEKYSFISVERIEKELNALKNLGTVKYINFIDDTFNIPKKRFVEILKMMIRNDYGFQWYSFYRCDFGNEEIIDLMKEAGCIGIFLGIESANNDILVNMNKTSRLEHYQKAIPYLKKLGIILFASTIIGFPGETYKTVEETNNLIEETSPDFFRPQIFWSDPLTPIWQQREKYGLKGLGFNWIHNTMDSKTAYDLFERTFLSVKNSIWVPDPGFNAYGMYYLLERGMNIDQIKGFLSCFNAAVKEKILLPDKDHMDPVILNNLRSASNYDKNKMPDMAQLSKYSGQAYLNAENFWLNEFQNYSNNQNFYRKDKIPKTKYDIAKFEKSIFDDIILENKTDPDSILIIVFGIILSKLLLIDDIGIICAFSKIKLFPARLTLSVLSDFYDLIKNLYRKKNTLADNSHYAFNILDNRIRLKMFGQDKLNLSYGYIMHMNQEKGDYFEYFTELKENLNLIFISSIIKKEINISLELNTDIYDDYFIQKFKEYFNFLIDLIVEKKDFTLNEIFLRKQKNTSVVNSLKDEKFHF